jgi:hypothetical protein
VTDYREYIARRLVDPQGEFTIWGKSILQAYSRVAKLSFVPVLGVSRESNLLVLGAKIFNQLNKEARGRTHLVLTARDILRCASLPRSLTYDLKSYDQLYSLIENDDEEAYAACKNRAELILMRTQANVIIANSTIDPINRLWLKVGGDLGLRTVCIQHGVYSEAIPRYVLEEDIIDRYIALDDGQASILQKNIPREKIVSLGVRDTFKREAASNNLKFCFVGEDWERYGLEDVKRMLTQKYIDVATFLKSHGYEDFCYKPHPSETMLNNIDKSMDILQSRNSHAPDVYFGFSSTLLKEMSSQSKLAIQFLDEKTRAENFQSLGYCLTIENDANLYNKILDILFSPQEVPFIRNSDLESVVFR